MAKWENPPDYAFTDDVIGKLLPAMGIPIRQVQEIKLETPRADAVILHVTFLVKKDQLFGLSDKDVSNGE